MARHFDLDLLNALVVVADAGSLSAAAPRLCRSQSAVSEQIRKLEEICGLPLLVRGKRGATPTPAGDRLIGHARELLILSDAAFRDMRDSHLAGDLRLAITDYFRPGALPGILRRVRDRFPRLHLHVSIRKSALIEKDMEAGAFDLGISMAILDRDGRGGRPDPTHPSYISLRREPLMWVADPSFSPPVVRSEDGRIPLLVLPETCSLQRFVVRMLDASGVSYVIAHSASGVAGLQMAVTAGLGVTCLNGSAVPDGAVAPKGISDLPTLPEVDFRLTAPRAGEPAFLSEVRELLVDCLR
jgi:DNA-binding transcriptional LysR family regulator